MPSAVIATIEYDPASSRLRIVYVSGSAYDYLDVPKDVYEKMKTVFAKGNFLNKEIKGKYKFVKIK